MRKPFRFWHAIGNLAACVLPVLWMTMAGAILYLAIRTSGAAVLFFCIGLFCLAVAVWLAHRMYPGGGDDDARGLPSPDRP